jgi:hypothetical protein
MMLRREVELPARLHQRVSFYLGLAGLLLSLSIILDAALWARPTLAVERAVTVRRLHLRPPCADRKPTTSRPLSPPVPSAHAELMKQLEHASAAVDDFDPGGRYGKYGKLNAVGPELDARETREAKAALERAKARRRAPRSR